MQNVFGSALDGALLGITVFVLSFVLSYFLLRIFITTAITYNFLDVPDGNIKCHEKPIPHLGGLALYVSFMVSSLGVLWWARLPELSDSLYAFYTGITLFLLVGLIDDRISLKPYQKALGQCVAAACVVFLGVSIPSDIFFYGDGALLSIAWMVTIVNAFNLIDIMDGLTATVSFFIALFFLCVALSVSNPVIALCMLVFLGSLFAFFLYNKPPASIYLGDAGALYIGGLLSMTALLVSPSLLFVHYNGLVFILMFAIPLLELTGLIIIRTYKGISFYLASRDHFALRFRDRGWSTRAVLVYVSCLSTVLFLVSYLFFRYVISTLYYACAALFFVLTWIYFLTSRHV